MHVIGLLRVGRLVKSMPKICMCPQWHGSGNGSRASKVVYFDQPEGIEFIAKQVIEE